MSRESATTSSTRCLGLTRDDDAVAPGGHVGDLGGEGAGGADHAEAQRRRRRVERLEHDRSRRGARDLELLSHGCAAGLERDDRERRATVSRPPPRDPFLNEERGRHGAPHGARGDDAEPDGDHAGHDREEAARLMKCEDVGALPIVEDARITGVVTDRDLALR